MHMSGTLIDRILNQEVSENGSEEDAAIVVARRHEEEGAPWAATAPEGELAVDVYQTDNEIVIVAVIGGVSARDIAVEIHHDVVTIRGSRRQEEDIPYECYLTQECYWGPFSRTVVLPAEVQAESAVARFRQGALRIELPKVVRTMATEVPIIAEEEE